MRVFGALKGDFDMKRLAASSLASVALVAATAAPAAAQTFTLNGGLTVSGATNLGGAFTATGSSFVIPTQSNTPSNPCTPGQLLLGPGGSDSNGKGGWFYFCRLGGTWASADFGNLSSTATYTASEDGEHLRALEAEVASLRAIVCQGRTSAEGCRKGSR